MKRSRRLISGLIYIFILSQTLFSANLQKTYLMTDDIWIRADRLCREAGIIGPTPISPTTGAEIKMALERLDRNSLTERQKREYDSLLKELTANDSLSISTKYMEFDLDGQVALEAFGFNNPKNTYADEFFIPYRDRLPFLEGEIHAYFGNLLYLDFQYVFKDSGIAFDVRDGKLVPGDFFYNFTNISMLASPGMDGGWQKP